jgi:hypothetical protein
MFEHDAARTGADIQSRWLRIPAAIAYTGFSRASLYSLLRSGAIRSTMVYPTSSVRGIRVIDKYDIDAFFEHSMRGPHKMAATWRKKAKEVS